MDNAEALAILEKHNTWRRGQSEKPTHPKLLGEAIDKAIESLALVELKKNGSGL